MTHRREFIKGSATVGLTSMAGLAGCLSSSNTSVSILTWTGYGDVQDEIEDEVDVELDITLADGSAEMFTQMNAGGAQEFDIAIPNNEYVGRFMDAGIAAPMNQDVVTNYDGLYDRFQEAAETQFQEGGEIYGLPINFGWYAYGYDTTTLPEDHEHSYEVLFSEEYEGVDLTNSLTLYDGFHKTIMMTALYLGYDEAFEGSEIDLSDDQLSTIEDELVSQKENLSGFVTDAQTLTQEYSSGNAIASFTNRTTILTIQDGYEDIALAEPAENSLTWFEAAIVSQESDNKEAAWEVLNAYIDPEIGATFAERRLIPNTSQEAQENLSGDNIDRLTVDPSTLDPMIPFKPAANEEAWIETWERVKQA